MSRPLARLKLLIDRALAGTAALWPSVQQGFVFVHAAARLLGHAAGQPGARLRRRFGGLLGAMHRHRACAGDLAPALDHVRKVARSYRPGLFHTADVAGLPLTNNSLEQLFGLQRYHERRATGRRTASPGAVLRGSVRPIAGIGTRAQLRSAGDLGQVDQARWRELRRSLDGRRQARAARTRFRHDPDAYLAALEQQARQQTLPF